MKAVHIHSLQTPFKGRANLKSPALSSAYTFTANTMVECLSYL